MIWDACDGARQIEPISGILFRLVESQEQIATLGYVDTLEEQALLESLLERVKPVYPIYTDASSTSDGYHYLLKTPFRYPPLKWGSRFGRTHEPSLFYGGASIAATLAEAAYYRFVFWFSMDGIPVKNTLRTEHTLFSVGYTAAKGVRLQAASFTAYLGELTHPQHYLPCQLLGTAMRESGVEAFEYQSARATPTEVCVGLFTLNAFAQKQPLEMSQWLCEISAREAAFKQVGNSALTRFAIDAFLVEGELPFPA